MFATLTAAAGYCSLNAFAHSRDDELPGEARRTPARSGHPPVYMQGTR